MYDGRWTVAPTIQLPNYQTNELHAPRHLGFCRNTHPQDLRADLETLLGNLTPEARLVADPQRHLAPQESAALRARALWLTHLDRFSAPQKTTAPSPTH